MLALEELDEMKKKHVPKNVFSHIVMNLVNGIQKINVQSCGISSMERKILENIFVFFLSAIGQKWMFGNTLENIWGPNRFLLFYFVCGVGAGLVQELVQYIQYATTLQAYTSVNMGGHIIPMGEYLNMLTTVGASGAVYGILLAFGMMFPNSTLYIYFAIPIKAKWFVLIYGIIELFSGFTSADNVAHFAHLGGMLFGLFLILYWKKKGNLY